MERTTRAAVSAALVIAWTQVGFGAFGVLVSAWTGRAVPATLPGWVLFAQMAVFTASSVVLVVGGRDQRVRALAAIFAVVATSFARKPTLFLLDESWIAPAVQVVRSVPVDAALPFLAWLLFRDFPRGLLSVALRRVANVGLAASGIATAVLVMANVAIVLLPNVPGALQELSAFQNRATYWSIVYGLTLASLPLALLKARTARLDERRRAVLFASAIGVGVLPISLLVFAEVFIDAYSDWMHRGGDAFILPVFEALVLWIPLATTYTILVDRVLPVRVLLRQVLQYNLARAVVTVAAALPFAWIAWAGWRLRGETLVDLAEPRRLLALGGAAGVGLLAVRVRSGARDAIERTFFREAYDTRKILVSVAEQSQQVRRVEEWAELITSQIDRALHLEHVSVLVADRVGMRLEAVVGPGRALALKSELVAQLARDGRPLDVDLERPGSELRALPEADRHWLADADLRLLVPVRSSTRDLIGLLALGGKRSELAFSTDDKELLGAVAASGAVTLEHRLSLGSGPVAAAEAAVSAPDAGIRARECAACGVVAAPTASQCPGCSSPLRECALPLELLGKFRLERREGEGAMGVVFRARDLSLDRTVAIKTLPAGSPEESLLLRREARAMAAVQHPNLALIYSAESWLGTPLLVTEFLEGGTVADRLAHGPIPLDAARRLGADLGLALARLHHAGILHRDVKPSNIGFGADGTPKLLDFGLARMVHGEREPRGPVEAVGGDARRSETGIVGTPLYMSPEALRGQPADAGFDVWGLTVALFEAVAGRHPLERETWLETRRAIDEGGADDLREHVPDAPAKLAELFADALAVERRRRPSSAEDFATRWSGAFA